MSAQDQILSPVSEVDGFFSKRYLPPMSGRQPRAKYIVHIISRLFFTPLTKNSKGDFLCPVLRFLLYTLWLLGRALSTQVL